MRALLLAATTVAAVLLMPTGAHAAGARTASHVDPDAGLSCGATTCRYALLDLINQERAKVHEAALTLNTTQSLGTGSCVGTLGHTLAMIRSGGIWHTNARYPHASFPHNLCLAFNWAGENVGVDQSGNVWNDVQSIHKEMMAEPHSKRYCAVETNHACNILDPRFDRVGIAVETVNGTTWLTEDFLN